jgi:tetratricopeptide (TPR) repeat protein
MYRRATLLLLGLLLSSLSLHAQVPQTADSYLKEGEQKQKSGDLESALADYDKAIAAAQADAKKDDSALATLSIARVQRETVLMAKRDFDTAWSTFLKDKAEDDSANIGISARHCYMWVIRASKGQKEEGDRELTSSLSGAASKIGNLEESIQIAKYLVNLCSESDLITFVQKVDGKNGGGKHPTEGEAWYFVGMKYLLAEEQTKAVESFQKILTLKGTTFNTRTLARAELKMLSPNSN